MATFFGEVTDVNSRSAWWSDSDEPDPVNESLSFSVDVKNNSRFSDASQNCKRIYVNNVKKHPNDFRVILTVSLDDDSLEKSLGNLVNLYRIDKDKCWITINHKLMSEYNYLTVKMVDFLFENVLNNFGSDSIICIVSTRLSSDQFLYYLSNERQKVQQIALTDIRRDYLRQMPPSQTAFDEIEMAMMEYCIVYKKSFVFFIVPPDINIELFPKFLIKLLKRFTAASSSNMTS